MNNKNKPLKPQTHWDGKYLEEYKKQRSSNNNTQNHFLKYREQQKLRNESDDPKH